MWQVLHCRCPGPGAAIRLQVAKPTFGMDGFATPPTTHTDEQSGTAPTRKHEHTQTPALTDRSSGHKIGNAGCEPHRQEPGRQTKTQTCTSELLRSKRNKQLEICRAGRPAINLRTPVAGGTAGRPAGRHIANLHICEPKRYATHTHRSKYAGPGIGL